jgi:hypothetical protein
MPAIKTLKGDAAMELAKREDAGENEEAKHAHAKVRASVCSVAEYISNVERISTYPEDTVKDDICSVRVEGIGGAMVVMSFNANHRTPLMCTTTIWQDKLLLSLSQDECDTIVRNIEQVRNFLSIMGEQNV